MDAGKFVTVFLYSKPEEPYKVPVPEAPLFLTAEDVCRRVATNLCFRPITFHLFGLRDKNNPELWLPACAKLDSAQPRVLELRLRFKLPLLTNLSRLDENAFNYLFHQMRHDLIRKRICGDDKESDVLGLCVMDMSRAIEEDGLTQEYVEENYRQFIPKEIWNRHFFFLKKKIHEHLRLFRQQTRTITYLKERYVSRVEDLALCYLEEQFDSMMYKEVDYPATIRVNPFHPELPGLSVSYIGKRNWEQLCSIEELCFISIRSCTAEISRKNGIPISFTFKNRQQLESFVSLLDGYYRLSEKWTFNLCNDLPSPFLLQLRALKCHGPVGDKFSQTKLTTNPNSKKGSFLLRQSSCKLDNFALDYILEHKNFPYSKEIEMVDGKFILEGKTKTFSSVLELILYYKANPSDDLMLQECLPPSDYDRSPLLICRSEKHFESAIKLEDISTAPHIISARCLQVYRSKKYLYQGRTCNVMKALWYGNKGKAVSVAIKFLKKQNDEKLMKEFLEMADRCVGWQCESLVSLRGIVLGNPQALVFEWLPYGPLDDYLQENGLHVQRVELLEAASHIAKAVWFLSDHGIVHGNVCAHNVLVAEQTDSGFIVKLSDPSISEYKCTDIHWIPPELMEISQLAKKFATTDVWALGTTLWEVFSYGAKPSESFTLDIYKQKYATGWRLPRPENCPGEIYRIISECWSQNSDTRRQPQATVRDIHQILYQFIGTKRPHTYASVSSAGQSQINDAFDIDNANWSSFGSEPSPLAEFGSGGTQSTFVNDINSGSNQSHCTQTTWLVNDQFDSGSPDLISAIYSAGSMGTLYSGSARGIYEFDKNQLSLGRIIGQGCYGAVYLGELVRSDGSTENVAVKMLKKDVTDCIPDREELGLQREFEILKKLSHQNIVEVKGVAYDPSVLLVMEYLPMGSLSEYFQICHTKPTLRQLLKFVQDVSDGMEYLSKNKIVHRDLAIRNLLLDSEDVVKISDFGLARIMDTESNCYTFRTSRKLPIKWYPPECLECFISAPEQAKFSEFSDVWSFGVTLFEIFSYGQDPILPGMTESTDVKTILNALKRGIRLDRPQICPPAVYSQLMLPCWKENANERPTFTRLVGTVREVENQLI